MSGVDGLHWSSDFGLLDGHAPAADALRSILSGRQAWFVIVCFGGSYHYVFSRAELLANLSGAIPYGQPLDVRLGLHEGDSSQGVRPGEKATPIDRPPTEAPSQSSVHRYVELDAAGRPSAVGVLGVLSKPARSTRSRGAAPIPMSTPTVPTAAITELPSPAWVDDEGAKPVRHPWIECADTILPGGKLTVVVNLLRLASAETEGGPLALGEQAANWETLQLSVTLVSAAIDFDGGGRGKVTIQRNQASLPAEVTGIALGELKAGDVVEVHAQFWLGTRGCGNAKRSFTVASSLAQSVPPAGATLTIGRVAIDPAAERPDLTVYITMFDPSAPGRLHWRLVTEPFDALPPRLDGQIDLGREPAREAIELFKEFAELPRGDHQRRIEAFGERLWKRAPAEFRDAYWALVDHYQRPLTIQFTSDDPHLPWELMRPTRTGESHPPLALKHAVARWIGAYQGWLRNRLPHGDMMVIAPRYSASLQLQKAQETAQCVVARYRARTTPGTRVGMLDLLERPPQGTVALLFFTGHGLFNDKAAAASAIKLENRESIAAEEVASESVRLGERDGTVVFFNACEVGATAGALGDVGGWAGAFLSRRFRAFIAPLWAIDEEDAGQATLTLIEQVVQQRRPIGEALRDLRQQFGAVSPTFYSYLLYGDVTARFGD